MKVETYLKKHPEIKKFWLQSGESFFEFNVDEFDHMHNFGHFKIKKIEEAPEEGELITLHI